MSETLVTQSEKYLKKIQSKPILAESIEDFDSFIEINRKIDTFLKQKQQFMGIGQSKTAVYTQQD